MVTSVDNIILVFTARGITRVSRQINQLGVQSAGANKSVRGLAGGVSALGAVLAVRQVVSYADSFTELQNRLRLVTDSSDEVTNATQNIFDIASKTRANIEETGRVYFRFARANERLGLSEKELLDVTTVVNQAVAFSGTNAESAASALFQFSQGIAAGTLRGQELNSVLEQIPGLAEVVARGLKVGVDQLRKLGEAGELTGKQIAQAVLSQREFAAEQFGNIIFTVSQEFERLRTEVIRYIGAVDQATGFSRALAGGIAFLSENLDLVAKGLKVVGALLAQAFAPKVIAGARALAVALAANPIGAIIVAVSTLITVMVGFREEIVVIQDAGVTLGTILEVAFGKIKKLFNDAVAIVTTFGTEIKDKVLGAINDLPPGFKDVLGSALEVISNFANPAIGLLTLPVRAMLNAFDKLPAAIGEILIDVGNNIRAVLFGRTSIIDVFTNFTQFIVNTFSGAFGFIFESAKELFFNLKELNFEEIDFDLTLPSFDDLIGDLGAPQENPFEGATRAFIDGFVDVLKDTTNRDFIGEASSLVTRFKDQVVTPFLEEVKAAQKAKDALGQGEPARPEPSDVRPDLGPQPPDAKVIKEVEKLTARFQNQNDKLRDSLDTLRLYRDAVEQFPDSFKVSVEEVDKAISELERRISGTVDLQVALWETAAEAGKAALVDFFLDPVNASFKELASNFVNAMHQIVAEALATQAILAALNFIQGFTSFRIPGATAPVAGSQFGQTAIGGQPRLVGENGPEIILPQSRTSVIANDKLGIGNKRLQTEVRDLTTAIAAMAANQQDISIVNSTDPRNQLVAIETARGRQVQNNNLEVDREVAQQILGF
jgi:tape measure domain-containing protein